MEEEEFVEAEAEDLQEQLDDEEQAVVAVAVVDHNIHTEAGAAHT